MNPYLQPQTRHQLIPTLHRFRFAGLFVLVLLGAIFAPGASAQTPMLKFSFEDTGTTTVDSVAGVPLNLVNSGNTATDLHGAAGSGVAGVGKALDFSSGSSGGSGPLASVVNSSAVNFGSVGSFTMTLWFKPTAFGNFPRFFWLGPNGTTDQGTGKIGIEGNGGSATSVQISGTVNNTTVNGVSNIVVGQWNFLAFTWDGSTYQVYVANETKPVVSGAALSGSGSIEIGSTFSLGIGNRINRDRSVQGYIDDVRFYSGAADATFLDNVRREVLPDPLVGPTSVAPSSAPAGSVVVIKAISAGTEPLAYQWLFTDSHGVTTEIPGATSSTYVLQNVQAANAGSYRLKVSNALGTVTNSAASLAVTPLADAGMNIVDFGTTAPVPDSDDASQLVMDGVTSGGSAQDGLNYYADSTAPGQTFTTGSNPNGYVINGVFLKTAGLDSSGTTTAQSYTLRLYSIAGGNATLLSTYVTSNTLAFADGSWLLYSGGFTNVLQPNATYAYTHHRNTTGWDLLGYALNGADLYPGGEMVVIPAAGGAVTFGNSRTGDAAFQVALSPTPSVPQIVQQPVSQTVTLGQSAGFSVGVIGAAPSYQWFTASDANYANATAISGATGSAYAIPSATLANGTNYFVVINGGSQSVTSSVATLTVRSSVNSLAWLGNSSFDWDLATANWSNIVTTTAGVLYQTGDNVQFTDAGKSSSPINLATALSPGSVTVSASSNYTFAGSGSLAGNVQLTKSGTGILTINNANTFRGSVLVNNGVLKLGNPSALGTATNSVTVNGGTLDIGGIQAPANLRFDIQGNGYTNSGAIVNTGGNSQNASGIKGLNLLGDATVGATGRWDLYGTAGGIGFRANNHNLTKVGSGSVFFIDGGLNNQLADATVLGGTLGFQGTNDLGDPTKTISVLGGGLAFFAAAAGVPLEKNLVLSNAFFSNAGGSLTLDTPITLMGTNTIQPGYQEDNSLQVTFNDSISGTGGWVINSAQNFVFNGANTYSGPTIINSAAILTVNPGSSLGNSSFVQLGDINASINLSATPGLTLGTGQTLAGIGNNVNFTFGGIYGNIVNGAGSTLSPGVSGPGTLSLYNDLTLSDATFAVDLGSDPFQFGNDVNDYVTVGGNLTLSGMNTIKLSPVGPLSSAAPYTILTYSGALTGGAANLQIVSANPRYTVSIIDPATTPGSIQIQVTGVPTPLVWKGGQSPDPNLWNHTAMNFFNPGTSSFDNFYDGDTVEFDDTAVTNKVNVTEPVAPSLVTLANNSIDYTFTGSGNISGTLAKEGSGAVTLAISNALALNTITANAGTLIVSPGIDSTLGAMINDNGSGLGTIVKAGTNLLTLTADNSAFNGTLAVTNGTLRYNALTALGASSTVYATNGGSIDINNLDTGAKNFVIAGMGYNNQGALANLTTTWPAWPYQIVHNVTLAGDAAIGVNARVDVASGAFVGNGFKLTKVGGSQLTLVDVAATGLGDVDIVSGNLTFQGTTDMGDPAKAVIVRTNASLGFWAGANAYAKANVTVINGTITSGGGANTLNSTITLQPGTNAISTSGDFSLLGAIVGPGGFIKQGGGTLWLYGANTYSGPTIIGQNSTVSVASGSSLGSSSTIEIDGGSTLDVSAVTLFSLGTGQTLIGNGNLKGGDISFNSGSTLSVGFAGGTATLNATGDLTLQSGSTDIVDVNKTTGVANDKVLGLSSVTLGGTLMINNLGSALAAGDAIQLFGATNYSGSFESIVPATPGTGLQWDTSTLLTDGTLRVKGTIVPQIGTTKVSNGNFVFSGSGGTPGGGYTVLSQTNLAQPLINWEIVGSGTFDGTGAFSFTNAIAPGTPHRFYLIRVP
ncbi:MAG TPA: LamG-like jellyroll fold domain-containing protein [Verrucomicrobiae bacterium]|nr:LamG-like jellyroll fold domain-containing protein [Verrucomicrobiae bacterium]